MASSLRTLFKVDSSSAYQTHLDAWPMVLELLEKSFKTIGTEKE
ncbi:hypothetical protein [Planktosalinus lacus]|nr:hypothetical protein [Planktosalinus lacus]